MDSLVCFVFVLGNRSNGDNCLVYSHKLYGSSFFYFYDFDYSCGFWVFGEYNRIDSHKYRVEKPENK